MTDDVAANTDAIRRIYRTAELAYRQATILLGSDGRIVEAHKFGALIGSDDESLVGQEVVPTGWGLLDASDAPLDLSEHPALRCLRSGRAEHAEVVMCHDDERTLLRLHVYARPVTGEPGAAVDVAIEDHDRRARGRAAIESSEHRFEILAELLPVAVYEATPSGEVTYINAAFTRLTGYERVEDVPDLPMLEIVHPDDVGIVLAAAGRTPETGEYLARYRVRHIDTSTRWVTSRIALLMDDSGSVSGFVGAIEDVDDLQRAEREARRRHAELAHDARHDPLTGLANRDVLDGRRAQDTAAGRSALVFYADIDRFKAINDNHGHGVGDAVLVEVARRIGAVVRDHDVVARIGGDEFVGWCQAPADRTAAEQLVERVGAVVCAAPIVIEEETKLEVTISVGAVVVGAERLEDAMSLADGALYRAKRAGRDRWVVGDGTPVPNSRVVTGAPDRRGERPDQST